MESYKSGYVMVLYPWKKNPGSDDLKLPQHVRDMAPKETIIPLVVVTDPSTTRRLDAFSAKDRKGDAVKKGARDLRRQVKADPSLMLAANSESAPSTPSAETATAPEPTDYLSEERLWTNAEGRSITAALVAADTKNAVFEIAGKKVTYPLVKLSSASRADIANLQR